MLGSTAHWLGWAGGWAGVRELTRLSRDLPFGTLFWAAEPLSNVWDWFKPRFLHIPIPGFLGASGNASACAQGR